MFSFRIFTKIHVNSREIDSKKRHPKNLLSIRHQNSFICIVGEEIRIRLFEYIAGAENVSGQNRDLWSKIGKSAATLAPKKQRDTVESVFLERPFVILWKNVPWMEVSAKCVDDFRPRSVRFHLRCQWTSIFPSGIFAFLHRYRLIISIHRYISFDIYLSRNSSSSSSSLDLSIVIFFFLRNHIEKLNSNVIRIFHSSRYN